MEIDSKPPAEEDINSSDDEEIKEAEKEKFEMKFDLKALPKSTTLVICAPGGP